MLSGTAPLSSRDPLQRSAARFVSMRRTSPASSARKSTAPRSRNQTAWVAWSQKRPSGDTSIRNSRSVSTVMRTVSRVIWFSSLAAGAVFAIKCLSSMT